MTEPTEVKQSDLIRKQLVDAERRLSELRQEKYSLEKRLREIGVAITDLVGGWHLSGEIDDLNIQLKNALTREEMETSPRVRAGGSEWAFVKRTPKRIYLRSFRSLDYEYWNLDGTSSYRGTIHPDDLRRILEGEITA